MDRKVIVFGLCLRVSAVLFSSLVQADCKVDMAGDVWCSKFAHGQVVADSLGDLVCGKGECRKDSLGDVYCSKVEGGGAALDTLGLVKCLGGCEPASAEMCERGQE